MDLEILSNQDWWTNLSNMAANGWVSLLWQISCPIVLLKELGIGMEEASIPLEKVKAFGIPWGLYSRSLSCT